MYVTEMFKVKKCAEIEAEASYPNLAKITNKTDYVKQDISSVYKTESLIGREIQRFRGCFEVHKKSK